MLIVLEGTDGSGKSTQFRLLTERLNREGQDYQKLAFPRYGEESSALIRQYLRGDFGNSPDAVNPYAASAFYAVDRYASWKTEWEQAYQTGRLILSDRYTTSNAVHQGAKTESLEPFLDWLQDLEYRKLGLPEPDMVIWLDMPADAAAKLLRSREAATGTHADIHEKDIAYLTRCYETGTRAAAYYGWKTVSCIRNGVLRTEMEIHEDVYRMIKNILIGLT